MAALRRARTWIEARWSSEWKERAVARYGLAVVSTAVAAGLRWVLDPLLLDTAPYTLFFFAVALSAAMSGWQPALFATGLGGGLGFWLFIVRADRLEPGEPQAYFQLGLYALTCALIAVLGEWGRRQYQRAQQSARIQRDSEARLRLALAAGRVGTWETDYRTGETVLSEQALSAFGFRAEEGPVQSIDEVRRRMHPEDCPRVLATINAGLEQHREYRSEFRIVLPDGSIRWVAACGVGLRGESGAPRTIGALVDMTEQKRAETEVRLSEERLRFALETSQTGAWDLDLTDHSAFRSVEHDRIFGYPDLLTHWSYELFLQHVLAEDRVEVDAKFQKSLAAQADWSFECRIRRLDGQVRWIWAAGRHRPDGAGGMRRMAGIVQDITERKSAEEAVQRQARLIDLAPAATLVRTLTGTVTFWSDGAERLYGWTREEALGQTSHVLLQTQFPVALEQISADLRTGGNWSGELRHRTKGGREVIVESHWLGQSTPAGELVEMLESNMDITSRKEAETALERERAFVEAVLQACQAGIIVAEPGGKLVRMNPANERLWGLAPLSASIEEYREWKGWWADGSPRQGRRLEPHEWALARSLRGEVCPGDIVEIEPFGAPGTRRTMINSGAPVLGPAGQVLGGVIVQVDISALKWAEAELRALKGKLELLVEERTAQLTVANKELEAFGYSVSHDLRAPLRHIDSYIHMLQKNPGTHLDEKGQKYLHIIIEAAKRMGQLIDGLLTLSRVGRTALEERPVSLLRLVNEARQELALSMADRLIEWRVVSLPLIRGDLNLLRSVITNLLGNGIKYTRGKQPAIIEIGCRTTEGEVICYVRDNGTGFDMRFVDKLFGVFQRLHTAQEFEGTGIGLASVRRVIERHGGRTWAEGELGKGATFYFTLPASRIVDAQIERDNGKSIAPTSS